MPKLFGMIIFFLQDTSRNLRQVDEMLGRYRDYSIGQAGAIEQVRVFLFALFTFLMEMLMLGKGI